MTVINSSKDLKKEALSLAKLSSKQDPAGYRALSKTEGELYLLARWKDAENSAASSFIRTQKKASRRQSGANNVATVTFRGSQDSIYSPVNYLPMLSSEVAEKLYQSTPGSEEELRLNKNKVHTVIFDDQEGAPAFQHTVSNYAFDWVRGVDDEVSPEYSISFLVERAAIRRHYYKNPTVKKKSGGRRSIRMYVTDYTGTLDTEISVSNLLKKVFTRGNIPEAAVAVFRIYRPDSPILMGLKDVVEFNAQLIEEHVITDGMISRIGWRELGTHSLRLYQSNREYFKFVNSGLFLTGLLDDQGPAPKEADKRKDKKYVPLMYETPLEDEELPPGVVKD